jgi:hypothetical protein
MKSFFRYSSFLLIALCLALPLAAGPITYTMTGFLTGTLGTAPVTGAAFTFVFNGDTAGISGTNPLLNPAITNSISITGFGTGQFTQAMVAGVNPTGGIGGFSDPSTANALTLENGGFVGWGLATPIGPLTNAAAYWASGSFTTDLGSLSITGARDLTFEATTTVPEPATAALAGLALLGLAGFRMSRARR